MKCEPNYLTTELLKGFTFKVHCAGLYMENTTSSILASTVPTWEAMVGPNFKNGILQYVTTDMTPTPASLMPLGNVSGHLEAEEKEEALQQALDKTGKSLALYVEDLLREITHIKNQQSAFDMSFTMKQRVCVEHLIFIIECELEKFTKAKVKSRPLHRFPMVWRTSMYFHNIFLLLGHYVRESYEKIISNDEYVSKVMLRDVGNGMKAYMCNTVEHLSESIAAIAPTSFDDHVAKRNADPKNHFPYSSKKQILKEMRKFNIKKTSTVWPSEEYVRNLENKRKKYSPAFTTFTKFPFGLTPSHVGDTPNLERVHPDISPDSEAYLMQINTTNTSTLSTTVQSASTATEEQVDE